MRLDVPVDAYIPAYYIPYEVAKIDIHRRIAASRDPEELARLREELEDRFGPPPEPVDNLIRLQEARIKLRQGRCPQRRVPSGTAGGRAAGAGAVAGEGAARAPARGASTNP